MREIEIKRVAGDVLRVRPLEGSYTYKAVGEIDTLVLMYELPTHTELSVGDSVVVAGTTYTLLRPQDLTMYHTQHYSYTATLYGAGERTKLYRVQNPVDKRLEFTLTATPHEHVQMLVDTMNLREATHVWQVGSVPRRAEVTVAYNHTTVLGGLQQLAEALETEWSIEETTLHIGEVVSSADPLELKYGEGNGIRPDVKRVASEEYPVSRLYVQTSERNIDPTKYGAKRLTLPKGKEAAEYRTDELGSYVELKGASGTYRDDSLDLTHIYPMREGTVSRVVVTDKGQVDFVDTSIPEALDYTEEQIPEEVMTVVFQSGMLAGRAGFEVHKYDHKTRTFQLVQREEDGVTMPAGAFVPKEGDRYAVFGCALPLEYVRQAEERALSEALKVLRAESQDQFEIRAEVDGIWASKHWATVAHRLVVGGSVLFSGPEWLPEPTAIRIVGVKTYLLRPYSPELELANKVTSGTLSSIIRRVEAEPTLRREETRQAVDTLAKRSYRQTAEVRTMVEKLKVDTFTESIRPETLQSLYAVIGNPALQFMFVEGGEEVPFRWAEDAKGTISIPQQTIALRPQGTTLQPTTELTTITIPALTYTLKAEQRQVYAYVSFKDPKRFILSDKPVEGALLIGMLTGEEGKRTLTTMYGFTEVTPGQLQTNLIRSKDGQSFWDLLTGRLQTKSDFIVGDPKGATALAFIGGKLYIKGGIITLGSEGKTIEQALREQDNKRETERKAREEAIRKEQAARAKERTELQAEIERLRTSNATDNATLTDLLNKVNKTLGTLQEQVDGEVSNWFYPGKPEAGKLPESEWRTNNEKARHIGDTYTSTDTTGEFVGKSWRYTTHYTWVEIHDTLISQALAQATKAQATADGKSTTFLAKPTRYETGDTWVLETATTINGIRHEAGTLLFATHDSPAFVESHWVDKVRYIGATQLKASEVASKAAWEAYANAKAKAERVKAEAYADGRVTNEEQARINAVNRAVEAAKAYAEAQDKLLKGQAEAYADGKITESEKAQLEVMRKRVDLAEANARAYADGKVTQAEQKAIDEATEAYNKAVKKAEELDKQLQVGGRNLLKPVGTYGTRVNEHHKVVVYPDGKIGWTQYNRATAPYSIFPHDALPAGTYTLSYKSSHEARGRYYLNYQTLNGLTYVHCTSKLVTPHADHYLHTSTYVFKSDTIRGSIYFYGTDPFDPPEEVTMWDFKLERGTVATDYTEAPEDVEARLQAEIDTINANPPRINSQGNWEVYRFANGVGGYVDTGRTSIGDDGKAPKIVDGYWYEWDGTAYTNTGVKAQGTKGDKGADGKPGRDGVNGKDGRDGRDGKDNEGLIIDTRNDNQPPSWYRKTYPKRMVREFKIQSAIEIPTGWLTGDYCTLITTTNWPDPSGGPVVQEVTLTNSRKLTRNGTADDTSWEPWQNVASEVTELRQGLTNANTLIQALEKADGDIQAGLTEKADYGDIAYLIDAFRRGGATQTGLLLANDIILSNPTDGQVTATISGSLDSNTFLKAGVSNFATAEEQALVEVSREGQGHFGNLYFGGNRIDIRKGMAGLLITIGAGVLQKSLQQVISSQNERTSATLTNVTISQGTKQLGSIKVPLDNSRVVFTHGKASATYQQVSPLQDNFDFAADGWLPENIGGGRITWRLIFFANIRIGAVSIATIRYGYIARREGWQYRVSLIPPAADTQSGVTASTGTIDLRGLPEVTVDSGTHDITVSVRKFGRETSTIQPPQLSITEGHIRAIGKKVTKQAGISDTGARFYGTENAYFDIDYNRRDGYTAQLAGGMHIKGGLTTDYIDTPGIPLCGAVFNAQGTEQKGFGRYKNKSGSNRASATYSYSTRSFTVYHSIPHDRYIPLVTITEPNAARTCTVTNVRAYSFVVTIFSGWSPEPAAFSYVAFQSN